MGFVIDSSFHMWFMLCLTGCAVYAFVREKFPLEVTSVFLMTILLLYGQIFSIVDENQNNLLDPEIILSGFANPSLIAVLALLVMGQAMIHTDSLRFLTNLFVFENKKYAWLSVFAILVFVMVLSAFMNNTPLVIIAIPVMQAVLHSVGTPASRMMMPLSYVAILGGMVTLVGSSTNMLVSSSMVEVGYAPLGFFDFAIPGAMLASVGFIYVILVVPRTLPNRASIKEELVGGETEFVAELDIAEDSKLVGAECVDGKFSALKDMNVKLIQRGGHLILPPFEGHRIHSGDILIVAATRQTLGSLLMQYPGFLLSEEEAEIIDGDDNLDDEGGEGSVLQAAETRVLAKIMITPASRMIDMSLDHVSFHKRFGAIVLGIQRRARVVRRRLGRIRLEAGDVLLIAGKHNRINNLRRNPDFIVLSGSKKDLPVPGKAPIAIIIFLAAISGAALGFLTIPVAAFAGAVAMIGTGCLNIRQATRAIDRKIFLLVGSMLALGGALQVTGGANYIADLILHSPFSSSPLLLASLLFIIVAITTNVLTNNACAILFTPIALNLAAQIETPPDLEFDLSYIFAVTVVFAANCSFASPIGYQTNLLVMGPGQYKFRDFIKAGVPLVIVMWIAYMFVAKYYFGLS
ncbi:MAG: SLC13 family permease [Alphaproteobacteria bacterium]|nr:MAG: SLC13 family permease [Alphaproteobacteria bacterium]